MQTWAPNPFDTLTAWPLVPSPPSFAAIVHGWLVVLHPLILALCLVVCVHTLREALNAWHCEMLARQREREDEEREEQRVRSYLRAVAARSCHVCEHMQPDERWGVRCAARPFITIAPSFPYNVSDCHLHTPCKLSTSDEARRSH